MNSRIYILDIGKFGSLLTFPHAPYPTCTLPIPYREAHTQPNPNHPRPRGYREKIARVL